jgi:hypothetical protein
VLKSAMIAFHERHSTLTCAVRAISDTGAHLRLDGSVAAPDHFDLIVALDGLEAPCEVVWRKAQDLGVRFTAPPRKVAPRRVQAVVAAVPSRPPTLRRRPK